jgi:hypothetical protein
MTFTTAGETNRMGWQHDYIFHVADLNIRTSHWQ